MLVPILMYFKVLPSDRNIPLAIVILSILCTPLCLWCSGLYFMQIFNKEPVLVINEQGINEQMNFKNSVGLICWEDIDSIKLIHNVDSTYYICIWLKDVTKYIKNEKRLKTLNRGLNKKFGHVYISSMYFNNQFKEVINLINQYNSHNGIIEL